MNSREIPTAVGPLLQYYYDLGKAPITFDSAVAFAVAAAFGRLRGFRGMKVNIIASRFRIMSERERSYDMGTRQWRLNNIILRLATLIPFVADIELVRDQVPELVEPKWPHDYDPADPKSKIPYLFGTLNKISALGGDVQVYRNTAYSQKWAESILPVREKSIVLAIRNADHDASRDSKLDDWFALYKHLSQKGFDVVVIPDQGDVLGANYSSTYPWRICIPAAMDIELRLALYRNSVMNFAWSSGNTALLYLSDASFTIFGVLNSKSTMASVARLNNFGITVGQQPQWFKEHQAFLWRDAAEVEASYLIESAEAVLAVL